MKNLSALSIVAIVLFTAAFACNFGTANLSSFATSKDKDGKQPASDFKTGETLYARAQVANNSGKVKVKMYLVVDDAKGMNKGDMVKQSDVSVDLEGDNNVATYSLPLPDFATPGKYILTADMLNDAGEKKDTKTAPITIAVGTPTAPTTSKPSTKSDDDDDDK